VNRRRVLDSVAGAGWQAWRRGHSSNIASIGFTPNDNIKDDIPRVAILPHPAASPPPPGFQPLGAWGRFSGFWNRSPFHGVEIWPSGMIRRMAERPLRPLQSTSWTRKSRCCSVHLLSVFLLMWAMAGFLYAEASDRTINQFVHTGWSSKNRAPG